MQKGASCIAVLITCVCAQVFWNCRASESADDLDHRDFNVYPQILSSSLPRISAPSRVQLSHDLGGLQDRYQLDAVIIEARGIIRSIIGYKEQPRLQIPMTLTKNVEVKNEVTVPIVIMPQAVFPAATVLPQSQLPVSYSFPPLCCSALPILNFSNQTPDREVVAPVIAEATDSAQLNSQREPDREVGLDVTVPIVGVPQAESQDAPELPALRALPILYSYMLPRLNNSTQIPVPEVAAPVISEVPSAPQVNPEQAAENVGEVDVTIPITQSARQETQTHAERLMASEQLLSQTRNSEPELGVDVTVAIAQPASQDSQIQAERSTALEQLLSQPRKIVPEVGVEVTAPIDAPMHAERSTALEQLLSQTRNSEPELGVDVTVAIAQPASQDSQIQAERSTALEQLLSQPRKIVPEVGVEVTAPIDAPMHAVASNISETPLPAQRSTSTPTTAQITQEYIYVLASYFETMNGNGNSVIATAASPANTFVSPVATSAPVDLLPIVSNSSPVQVPALSSIQLSPLQSLYTVQQSDGIQVRATGKRADVIYNPKVQQMSFATYQAQQPIYSGSKSVFLNNSKHNELTPGSVMFVRNLIIEETVQKPTEEIVNNFMSDFARFLFLLVVF